jgi:hypothetical protein
MALILCPECGKMLSDSADSCPHCGFKQKPGVNKKRLLRHWAIGFFLVCLFGYGFYWYRGTDADWTQLITVGFGYGLGCSLFEYFSTK